MHRRKYFFGIAIVAVVTITACGGNDEPSSGATEPPATNPTVPVEEPVSEPPATLPEEPAEPSEQPEATSSPPATEPSDPCSRQQWPGGTAPRIAEPETALGNLTGARVGRHGCYDRVAFDFTGLTEASGLGYRVEYVSEVERGGSGDVVGVEGTVFLQVKVAGKQPVPGVAFENPVDYSRDWPALRGVSYGGHYEGEHTFAIGLTEEVPFRVVRFENDAGEIMVYIDFGHPSKPRN